MMAKNFKDILAALPPERQAKITEQTKQELAKIKERTMSVFKILAEECNGESYTGRGMKDPCLGFICSSALSFISEALDIISGESTNIQEYLEEFAHAIKNARTDNMGMSMIIYFPYVSASILEEADDEEDECEEDEEEEEVDDDEEADDDEEDESNYPKSNFLREEDV